MVARLKEHYEKVVRPALQERFRYENPMEVPKIQKIVVNMGVGEAAQDSRKIEPALQDLAQITGQKPIATRSKKAIANFKIREGLAIGAKVTLRRDRMYEFLDRVVNIALPRARDFRGIPSRGFDGAGNYTFGIKEQIIFPEIDYDKVDRVRGMDVTIVTTARTDEEARALLDGFDMPFMK